MSEDFLFEKRRRIGDPSADFDDDVFNAALLSLEDMCVAQAGRTLKELRLPEPVRLVDELSQNREVIKERGYNLEKLRRVVELDLPRLNAGQRQVFDHVLALADANDGGMVFIDAPGGTGKTFLLEVIAATLRLRGAINLAVASSGIAATM